MEAELGKGVENERSILVKTGVTVKRSLTSQGSLTCGGVEGPGQCWEGWARGGLERVLGGSGRVRERVLLWGNSDGPGSCKVLENRRERGF